MKRHFSAENIEEAVDDISVLGLRRVGFCGCDGDRFLIEQGALSGHEIIAFAAVEETATDGRHFESIRHHKGGHGIERLGLRLFHDVGPDGKRDGGGVAGGHDFAWLVVPDPDAGDEMCGEALEPGVLVIVRRAGLAGGGCGEMEFLSDGRAGAEIEHVFQNAGDLSRDLRSKDPVFLGLVLIDDPSWSSRTLSTICWRTQTP